MHLIQFFKGRVNLLERKNGSPGSHGSIDKQSSPSHPTTSKFLTKNRTIITQNHQNQVEWKSHNYRVKETISIQNSRRSRDTEQTGPTSTCGR